MGHFMSKPTLKRARDASPHEPPAKRAYTENHQYWLDTLFTMDIAEKLASRDSTLVYTAYTLLAPHVHRIMFDMSVGTRLGRTAHDTVWILLLERMFGCFIHQDHHRTQLLLILDALIQRLETNRRWCLHTTSKDKWTCLHYAVAFCRITHLDPVCMRFLDALMKECFLESRDSDGDTPFAFAGIEHDWMPTRFSESITLMRFMIDRGANPSAQDDEGRTLLHVFAYEPNLHMKSMMDLMQAEVLGIDWTLTDVEGLRFDKCARTNPNDVQHRGQMVEVCDKWIERCMSFIRTENQEVIRVKPVTDLIAGYIDGSGLP
jgi:hypothetical protein